MQARAIETADDVKKSSDTARALHHHRTSMHFASPLTLFVLKLAIYLLCVAVTPWLIEPVDDRS
jgi:hypothetical protein